MDNKAIEEFGRTLYNAVFQALDADRDITGDEAGKIATAVEHAFSSAAYKVFHSNQMVVVYDENDDGFVRFQGMMYANFETLRQKKFPGRNIQFVRHVGNFGNGGTR